MRHICSVEYYCILICLCVHMYGSAYACQQFVDFLGPWKIAYTTGIPYNPQGQVIVKKTNTALEKLFTRAISPQARRDSYLTLTEILFPYELSQFL